MHATPEQALAAYNALTDVETRKLQAAAHRLHRGTDYTSGEDLLSQALDAFLSGRRQWLLQYPFGLFLSMAMRSIAGHDRKRHTVRPDLHVRIDQDLPMREMGAAELAMSSPSAEDVVDSLQRAAAWKAWVAKVEARLKDRDEAVFVLLAKLAGTDRSGILKQSGMDPRDYDSAMREIKKACQRTPRPS